MLRLVLIASAFVALSLAQVPPDPCRDCRIENGVGYKGHVTRCDQFFICMPMEGGTGYDATLRSCPCGLFWSQTVLACVFAGDLDCPTDPCRGNVPNYADPDSCKAYWVCEGRRSKTTLCCPANQRYSAADRDCVPDPDNTCTDKCPCAPRTTVGPTPCQFSAVVGQPGRYLWTFANGGSQVMLCPPGVHFNATACGCTIRVAVSRVSRCMDFSVRYSEIPLIDHAKNAWIDNKGVVVTTADKTGLYANRAYLSVPRYSNIDWPDVFGLDLQFNGQNNANNDGPLLDNCDCNEPSTISLRLKTTGPANNRVSSIELVIKTVNGDHTLEANYNTNAWNRVKVAYDGTNIILNVESGNNVVGTDTEAASGKIANCQCGLKIGYAWQNRYFNGLMGRTDIYLRCLPNNFI